VLSAVPAPHDEHVDARNSNRPCVLVVDDDPDSLRATVRLLELNGYVTRGACGFNAAVDVWATSGCAILVADLALPDGSGLDLMRRFAPAGVCGVSVSGHTDPANLRASRDAGFAAHLVKPIRFEDLLAAVARLA
jgi:CheY-like chemotaxis protein